jgi:hypothetical protein
LIVVAVGATLSVVAHRERSLTEAEELDALARAYPGLIQQLRIEHLNRRLKGTNGIVVAHSQRGMHGDRLRLWLERDEMVRLWLFWPIRSSGVAALLSIVWADDVGWVVDVRSTAGDHERIYAWRVQIEHQSLTDVEQ